MKKKQKVMKISNNLFVTLKMLFEHVVVRKTSLGTSMYNNRIFNA